MSQRAVLCRILQVVTDLVRVCRDASYSQLQSHISRGGQHVVKISHSQPQDESWEFIFSPSLSFSPFKWDSWYSSIELLSHTMYVCVSVFGMFYLSILQIIFIVDNYELSLQAVSLSTCAQLPAGSSWVFKSSLLPQVWDWEIIMKSNLASPSTPHTQFPHFKTGILRFCTEFSTEYCSKWCLLDAEYFAGICPNLLKQDIGFKIKIRF